MFLDRLIAKRVAAFESEIMQKYFTEVENMYASMRAWRHDYRHHIQTMKAHAANGEYEQIDRYLDQLDNDLTKVETIVRTGNRMADAVLNSKLSLAAKNDIRLKIQAQLPQTLQMTELDLCIIIGNLLDNAISACMELPPEKRLIRIYMEMKGNFLYLSFINTAPGKKQTSFLSRKGEGHGYGLSRVDAMVQKYGGYVNRASEDEAFSTEVLLPQ